MEIKKCAVVRCVARPLVRVGESGRYGLHDYGWSERETLWDRRSEHWYLLAPCNESLNLAGLGVANGQLYSAASGTLYQVNVANGSLTKVGASAINYSVFGSTLSGLYAVLAGYLYSIDPGTGAATQIGNGILPLCGSVGALPAGQLSTNSATLYYACGLSLYTIDVGSGTPALVGKNAVDILTALTSINDTLYAGNVGDFAAPGIYSVNPANGALSNGVNLKGIYADSPTGLAPLAQTGPSTGPVSYYFSQLAVGGGFQTTLTYINYSPQEVTCVTNFYSDSGSALSIPFSEGPVATRTDALQAGQSVHDQTIGNPAAVVEGWAQASCTGPVQASVLFRLYQAGVPVGEASVNAETAPTTQFATFAQTATGVAYANPSSTQSATVTFTVYNAAGTRLGSQSTTLGPLAHGSANLGPLLGIQDFTGFVKITSTLPIISLSLNAEAFPVFSSLPPGDLPGSATLVTP